MSGDLDGKTAIITGASRGIGLASAQAMADAGASVVLTSRHKEAADEAAALIDGDAAGFEAHALDEGAATRCVRFAIERFGGADFLVNNAGTNPAYGPLVEQDHDRFIKTLEVNLWAPALWSGIAWREWMSEHGGAIVNVASVGGFTVAPGLGVYNASKAGLVHLTRHLAAELAPRVRVNGVAPGVVRTRLAEALWKEREDEVAAARPLGRIGEPDDIGGVVAFLVSQGSSWMTGETIVVDGGELIQPAV